MYQMIRSWQHQQLVTVPARSVLDSKWGSYPRYKPQLGQVAPGTREPLQKVADDEASMPDLIEDFSEDDA